jgi:hypothetical protein
MKKWSVQRTAIVLATSALLVAALLKSIHEGLFVQNVSIGTPVRDGIIQVPFVGCASDGQTGLIEPPQGRAKVMPIPASAAQRLAYYEAEDGPGVLGPRGWHCFGTYGSSGATLYVSPEPIRSTDLLSVSGKGFSGPAIQISIQNGDTSGRFGVAETIARVFPSHLSFVQDVIAEGIEPASSFPRGPYPQDRLIYRGAEMVEFQTPADTDGLGTRSGLQKNDAPIEGVAALFGEETNLLQLSLRLSPETSDLGESIIRQTERDLAQMKD